MLDQYKTIATPSEGYYKEKGSKFTGFAIPIFSEDEFKINLARIKKENPDSGHYCYGFRIGADHKLYRYSDDGEPSSTAGKPIFGQIQSFELTNIMIVVTRYFGGTKLGVGGLINAYRTTAQQALESATIIEKTINIHFVIIFEYKDMNKVMRIIKENNITITKQDLELNCKIYISVRKKNVGKIKNTFSSLYEIEIKKFED